MRSLFLAMIPSVMVAAEVAAKEPDTNNNELIAIFDLFWQQILDAFSSVNSLVIGGEIVSGIVILFLTFALIKKLYRTKKIRHLEAPYALLLMNVIFVSCVAMSFTIFPWDGCKPELIILFPFILIAISWVVANCFIHIFLYVMEALGVKKSISPDYPIKEIKQDEVELYKEKRKGIFLRLRRRFCFRAIEDDEKISSETLYFAVRCLKSLLDSLANTNRSNNDIPEFQFVISGDTELLKELPTSTPYDILHFIELQSLWASEYNERQRKIQWRQGARAERHCQIIQDIRANPGKSTEESFEEECHKKLLESYEDWQPIPMYYAQNKKDKSGIMMDTIILEAVKQWNDRLPDDIVPVYPESLTRAIRVLFSSEQDLVDSAKQIALSSSIGLPLPKKEIVNIWIPIEDLSLFASSVMHWADGNSTEKWQNKFITSPRISSEEASITLTFVEVINKFMKDHDLDRNGSGLSDIIEKEFGKSEEQKKFMFLFIGNRMEKKDYRQKHPEIYTEEDKRRSCSNRHLAHLLVILMALYHKEALPFLRVINTVCNERKDNQANYLCGPEEKTRECISRIRISMENKRVLS